MYLWLSIGAGLLAVLVAACLPLAVYLAGRGAEQDEARRALWASLLWLGLALGASGALAAFGVLRDFSARPPAMMVLLVLLLVATLFLSLRSVGGLLARGLPLWILVGFQSFRLLVEVLLWGLHRLGRLPIQMTFEGLNFDVVTALTALPVAYLLQQGKASKGLVLAWNVLGLLLLATIMTIGILSTPIPIQVFFTKPYNTIMAELPFIWVPAVFVQAALMGHVITFRALRSWVTAQPPRLAKA